MKNIKDILYIHGYGSHGHTGEAMEKAFKEKYDIKVYHPQFSPYYNEARGQIDDFVKSHKVDLIIGTSLGGFMTLDTPGYFRIAVNPAFNPYEALKSIGVPEDIVNTYEIPAISLPQDFISKKIEVYGVFGGKDTVVDYKDDFSRFYNHNNMFFASDMEHSMSNEDIEKYLFNVVEHVDKAISDYKEFKMKNYGIF